MKKHYEKPLVAIEYYELTQTIASCSMKIGFLNSNCVIRDPDSTPQMKSLAAVSHYFVSGHCDNAYNTPGESNDGICYHTNLNAAFNS